MLSENIQKIIVAETLLGFTTRAFIVITYTTAGFLGYSLAGVWGSIALGLPCAVFFLREAYAGSLLVEPSKENQESATCG